MDCTSSSPSIWGRQSVYVDHFYRVADPLSSPDFGVELGLQDEAVALPTELGETSHPSTGCSRWEELLPDVLANIFHFLIMDDVIVASRVCRAWQTAACMELFLSRGTLDLRPLDHLRGASKQQYATLLSVVLSRPASYDCWKIFIAPSYVAMPDSSLVDFARRTPRLRAVSLPLRSAFPLGTLAALLPHWSQLACFRALIHRTATAIALRDLGLMCKNIRALNLLTRIGAGEAAAMVENFPGLWLLQMTRCVVTVEALVLILDGCKQLKKLDICHSKFVDEMDIGMNLTQDVIEKGSSLQWFLYCKDPGSCSECWTESFLF
ncbi:F-box/LRR-repeat protein At3g48880-like isoform X3 [Curcuma longa]|uniref:F-box/LRR-repeat protein At3g48880-like isoform X3 n=1 Tax=Curcuma longa TaxID=136217 RepID=UPI003D9E1371